MATFKLNIVSTEGVLLSQEADYLMIRTTEGDMGVLANHSPFVGSLAIGELKVRSNGSEEYYFVSGGFLEISKENVVTVLADEAMNSKDIDVEHAKKAAKYAEEKLQKLAEDKEIFLTQRALQEALTKVKLAERHM